MSLRALLACLLFAWSLALPAAAQVVGDRVPIEFRDRAEERRFHDLTSELRCVMCQNQSLADSNAPIAHDLRQEVFELMREGRSDAEIKTFLVGRYGEFVLYRPRLEGATWLLWFGPLVLLLLGGLVIARIVRRRAALGGGGRVPDDDGQEW
ncbi:MAG: cytochrome c-type biogenesis protein CcmH [Pseudomonadota bacterium]|nr:cytochrome c-type biogenesis protein CcmH [Pseudomonadota bacterium]